MPETKIEPPNIPDSIINPEHWNFYDPNLDAIKEKPITVSFGQNLALDG